ncbi:flavin reductase family protein [Acerihabitans sp. KWT182]|uniref:Flavin reductase family protein n=1 Tax=Acerihabitans sp. KWT182 TaxID=3157919 RepID=A0AAU7QDS8_9GAMM
MSTFAKKSALPVNLARRYLEPGPIVLVSSFLAGKRNIMTLGWHTMLEFSPSLIGCVISSGNHSFAMIRDSGECVINLPTLALTDAVVGIGNTHGADIDKFSRFGLTAAPAQKVGAPLIGECHAHFECRLYDDALVERYNFFIFEIVDAQAASTPKHPETLHYTGDGVFMVSGKIISRRQQFRPEML